MRPLLAHRGGRAQAVGPVDRRPAAQRGRGEQVDVEVGGRRRAAAPEQLLERGQLEAAEVGLVVVAARLEHDDVVPGLGQHAGDQTAAGAGADDAHVALDVARRGERRERFIPARGHLRRPGVAERLPRRVEPRPRIGRRIGERERQRDQRAHARGRRRAHQRHVAQQLLARALRCGREAEHVQAVEQRQETVELLRRQRRERLGDAGVGAEVAAARGPEPARVGVAGERRDEVVGQRAQDRAPAVGELRGHDRSSDGQLDLALEDLAGRPLGQLVDDPHAARVLVGRDLLLDERAQVLRASRRRRPSARRRRRPPRRARRAARPRRRPRARRGARRGPPRSRAGRRCSRRG